MDGIYPQTGSIYSAEPRSEPMEEQVGAEADRPQYTNIYSFVVTVREYFGAPGSLVITD
jgi:hypothetical protein